MSLSSVKIGRAPPDLNRRGDFNTFVGNLKAYKQTNKYDGNNSWKPPPRGGQSLSVADKKLGKQAENFLRHQCFQKPDQVRAIRNLGMKMTLHDAISLKQPTQKQMVKECKGSNDKSFTKFHQELIDFQPKEFLKGSDIFWKAPSRHRKDLSNEERLFGKRVGNFLQCRSFQLDEQIAKVRLTGLDMTAHNKKREQIALTEHKTCAEEQRSENLFEMVVEEVEKQHVSVDISTATVEGQDMAVGNVDSEGHRVVARIFDRHGLILSAKTSNIVRPPGCEGQSGNNQDVPTNTNPVLCRGTSSRDPPDQIAFDKSLATVSEDEDEEMVVVSCPDQIASNKSLASVSEDDDEETAKVSLPAPTYPGYMSLQCHLLEKKVLVSNDTEVKAFVRSLENCRNCIVLPHFMDVRCLEGNQYQNKPRGAGLFQVRVVIGHGPQSLMSKGMPNGVAFMCSLQKTIKDVSRVAEIRLGLKRGTFIQSEIVAYPSLRNLGLERHPALYSIPPRSTVYLEIVSIHTTSSPPKNLAEALTKISLLTRKGKHIDPYTFYPGTCIGQKSIDILTANGTMSHKPIEGKSTTLFSAFLTGNFSILCCLAESRNKFIGSLHEHEAVILLRAKDKFMKDLLWGKGGRRIREESVKHCNIGIAIILELILCCGDGGAMAGEILSFLGNPGNCSIAVLNVRHSLSAMSVASSAITLGPNRNALLKPSQTNSSIKKSPCRFYGTRTGCRNGNSCNFFHSNNNRR